MTPLRVVSTALALDQDGSLVLGRRASDPWRGGWLTPGGKVEAGETLAGAAYREFIEETGLLIRLTGPAGDAGVYELTDPTGGQWLVVYSHAIVVGGYLRVDERTDVDQVGFFSRWAVREMGQQGKIVGASPEALQRNGWLGHTSRGV